MNKELLNICKRLTAIIKAEEASKAIKVNEDDYGHDCVHQKQEYNGSVVCIECGLVFETVFIRDKYSTYSNNNPSKKSKYNNDYDEQGPEEHNDEVSEIGKYSEITSDIIDDNNDGPELSEPERSEPMCYQSMSAKELKKLAQKRGFPCSSKMTKKELYTVLEANIVPESNIVFTNKETGKEHGFKSLYKAGKEMNVNPGLIVYYHKKNKEIKIGDAMYIVRRCVRSSKESRA